MNPNCELDLAVEWARSAWSNLNLSIPVDLEKVRKHLGLYKRVIPLNGTAGYLLKTTRRTYIVVNSLHSSERQAFTVSHECCEYLLRQYHERHSLKPPEGEHKERLCDRFSVELLMPEELVRATIKEVFHSQTNNKTDVLASRFGVSLQAMKLRLREIKGEMIPSENDYLYIRCHHYEL